MKSHKLIIQGVVILVSACVAFILGVSKSRGGEAGEAKIFFVLSVILFLAAAVIKLRIVFASGKSEGTKNGQNNFDGSRASRQSTFRKEE